MQNRHYNLLSYNLTLVSYMTLTISLPLISVIANSLKMSITTAHDGISILFFMFSLSAIILSSLADMLSAFVVLKYAQMISILGLLILSFSQNQSFFLLGCFCLGAGTGSYASNARALISRHALDSQVMKKSFTNMSLLIILAPVLSFYLALSLNTLINWHFAYACMALIEIATAIYAYWVLSHEDSSYKHNQFSQLPVGFGYCLKQKIFFLNMLGIGVSFSIFMQIFMTNIHTLLITVLGVSMSTFDLLLLLLSGSYMTGILLFRAVGMKLADAWIRVCSMSLVLIGILIFGISHTLILTVLGIYVICIGLGFIAPYATGSGMTVIKKHHGSAAALYTFAFACISGIWSLIQAHLKFDVKNFINFGLWTSFAALIIIFVLLTLTSPVRARQR